MMNFFGIKICIHEWKWVEKIPYLMWKRKCHKYHKVQTKDLRGGVPEIY